MAQGVSTIVQVRALSASRPSCLWELVLPNVPGASADAAKLLTLRARHCTAPGISVAAVTSHFKGYEMQHPTKRKYSHQLTMRFEEAMDAAVLSALDAWTRVYADDETGLGQGEDAFLVDGTLNYVSHANAILKSYKIFGLFPQNLNDVDLGYEQEELLHQTQVFGYSYWTLA